MLKNVTHISVPKNNTTLLSPNNIALPSPNLFQDYHLYTLNLNIFPFFISYRYSKDNTTILEDEQE